MDTGSYDLSQHYPLSENQKGLWALQKVNPSQTAYNCPALLKVSSKIDKALLDRACKIFVLQYPIFCTKFKSNKKEPYQIIDTRVVPSVEYFNLKNKDETAILEKSRSLTKRPFNIEYDSLLRISLLTVKDDKNWILLEAHHLVCDGNSFKTILSKFFDIYLALINKLPISIIYNDSYYLEYVEHEETFLQSDLANNNLEYWRKKLDGLGLAQGLATDYPRQATISYQGDIYIFPFSKKLSCDVKHYAKKKKVTVPTIFLGVYQLLLKAHLGQEDITVGIPTAGRMGVASDNIGYYSNMVPIRSNLNPEIDISDYLKTLQRDVLIGCIKHYPFSTLVKTLAVPTSTSSFPFFCHSFTFQGYEEFGSTSDMFNALAPDISIHLDARIQQEGEYELGIEIVQHADGFNATFKYDPTLFNEATIKRISKHYLEIFEKLLATPECKISDLYIIPFEDLATLKKWNNTSKEYNRTHLLHELIEEQVVIQNNHTSVSFDGKYLSYRELSDLSIACADRLHALGVKKGNIVGVCMNRSLEMVVSLLAIIKTGAAYVPIDPELPADRLNFIANDSQSSVVLCQSNTKKLINNIETLVISIDDLRVYNKHTTAKLTPCDIDPSDTAYIIYTSGSTGKPKGCQISHRAICNRILWMQDTYPLTKDDVVLQKTPFSFDVSVWEFFWPLIVGARLEVAIPDGHKDPSYLEKLIESAMVSVCHFVPSMLNVFIESYQKPSLLPLKYIFTSGEALSQAQLNGAMKIISGSIENLYGPTEAAIDVTYWSGEVRDDGKVPIGKPISNIKLHVLNSQLQLCPIGVPGELFIEGIGLSDGYINQKKLTDEKFITHPTLNVKMYRTGDLSRWLPDGNIEYLGRLDYQVKIRGFRIELGEIEQNLSLHPNIVNVVVSLVGEGTKSQICAYYTTKEMSDISSQHLKDFLYISLPEYMVPSYFIELDALPTSYAGKVDRKKLPDLRNFITPEEKTLPVNDIEKKVVDIWKEHLSIDNFGTNSNFFDIGGDSLSAVMVLLNIEKVFSPKSVSQAEFYQSPTIQGIAKCLTTINKKSVEVSNLVSLSPTSVKEIADSTLVVCPYAGASIMMFKPLANALAKTHPTLDVIGAKIPGNELGDVDRNYNIIDLAKHTALELQNTVTGPILIYGHCVGSSFALEITHELQEQKCDVKALIAGGAFPFPKIFTALPIVDPWRFVSNKQLFQRIGAWGGPKDNLDSDVKIFMLNNFRKDAKETFRYQKYFAKSRAILCPIISIISKDDPLTKGYLKNYLRWGRNTSSIHLITMDKGQHYFVSTQPQILSEIITYISWNIGDLSKNNRTTFDWHHEKSNIFTEKSLTNDSI